MALPSFMVIWGELSQESLHSWLSCSREFPEGMREVLVPSPAEVRESSATHAYVHSHGFSVVSDEMFMVVLSRFKKKNFTS